MEKMAQNVSSTAGVPVKEFKTQDVIFKVDSLLTDKKNSNQIIDLIKGLLGDSEKDVMTSVDCLQRIFTGYLNTTDLLKKDQASKTESSDSDTVVQYKTWLRDQYNETKSQLLTLLSHPRKAVQQSSAEALLSFVIIENAKVQTSSQPASGLLKQMIFHSVNSEHDMKHVVRVFADAGLEPSMVVAILRMVCSSLKTKEKLIANDVYLLNVYAFLKVNWLPKKSDETDTPLLSNLKEKYTEAWVEFLKFQVPLVLYKKVLVDLHEKVLPNMKNPLILTDFLTESYNYGGGVSLLALNGLFFLIQKCNLEYPNFFDKLYALLNEEVFHAKYRPQFFYLMDLFLSSIHVPAYLIGAFVKKLSRLSLVAPPDALLIVLPFVKNLLIRHPNLKVMISRTDMNDVSNDPYLPEESCMSKCKAMESSLWEIKTLQHHWHPLVSKEAGFINKTLPSLETDMADVLDINFTQLFNQEIESKLHKLPLSYDTPKGLFSRSEDKMCNWWTC